MLPSTLLTLNTPPICLEHVSLFSLTFKVAVISSILLLPLYITGKSAKDKDKIVTPLERLTLITAKDDEYRIWIVFIIAGIFSVLGHVMLSKFDNKIVSMQQKTQD